MIRARTKSRGLEEGPSCSAALPADRAGQHSTYCTRFNCYPYDTLNDLDGTYQESCWNWQLRKKKKNARTK